ncbi:MAG: universal stress protein [Anaerolineae bacterium]|nr:universal stress protein [Anaerolineae bacterium]
MNDGPQYKRIVVPLDGSGFAELAIPHAAQLARKHEAELILLHVYVSPFRAMADQVVLAGQEEQMQAVIENMRVYLVGLRNVLRKEGVQVREEIIEATGPATGIYNYVEANEVDLVVISTHGRTGITRWLLGSVAQKVVQAVTVPVMLIRPDAK